uniref:Uncharacterized protein n=1 Tax=viral metagenome TaxID=1070528 RepID=A0A6C0IJ65_9ZZZZ
MAEILRYFFKLVRFMKYMIFKIVRRVNPNAMFAKSWIFLEFNCHQKKEIFQRKKTDYSQDFQIM